LPGQPLFNSSEKAIDIFQTLPINIQKEKTNFVKTTLDTVRFNSLYNCSLEQSSQ